MIQSGRTAHAKDGAVRYRIALTGPLAVLVLVLMAAMMPAGARAAGCTTTVSSTSAAASAVSSAAPGSVVCLADGSYGRLSLNASKSAPGVTVQAADPGAATIAGATHGRQLHHPRPVQGAGRIGRRPARVDRDDDRSQPHDRQPHRLRRLRLSRDHDGQVQRRLDHQQQDPGQLRRGPDPGQPLPRRSRRGPLRPAGRGQRVPRERRVGQPRRRLSVRVGRRQPVLPQELPARLRRPGLLRQGPAEHDRRARLRRQPHRAPEPPLRPDLAVPDLAAGRRPDLRAGEERQHPPQHGVARKRRRAVLAARLGLGRSDGVLRQRLRQPQLRRERPDDRLRRGEQHLLRWQRHALRRADVGLQPRLRRRHRQRPAPGQRARRRLARRRPALRPGRGHHDSPRHDRARHDDRLGPRRPDQ